MINSVPTNFQEEYGFWFILAVFVYLLLACFFKGFLIVLVIGAGLMCIIFAWKKWGKQWKKTLKKK